jgi:DNA polymerase III psi subunit
LKQSFYNFDIYGLPEYKESSDIFNSKSSLLVVCKHHDFRENQTLITNILKAIGFEEGKNATILKIEDEESIHLASLVTDTISSVISFGLMPGALGLNASFRPNRFYDTETFSLLLSYSCAELENNKKFKMALWKALQEKFKP